MAVLLSSFKLILFVCICTVILYYIPASLIPDSTVVHILFSTVPDANQRYEVLRGVLWVSFLFLGGTLTFTKSVVFVQCTTTEEVENG